jgi:hypothetical protein
MNFLDNPFSTTTIALLLFVIIVLRAALRVLPEWERAVVLRSGAVSGGQGTRHHLPNPDYRHGADCGHAHRDDECAPPRSHHQR